MIIGCKEERLIIENQENERIVKASKDTISEMEVLLDVSSNTIDIIDDSDGVDLLVSFWNIPSNVEVRFISFEITENGSFTEGWSLGTVDDVIIDEEINYLMKI
jgi:hypothetical protein